MSDGSTVVTCDAAAAVVTRALAEGGALADVVTGFRPRAEQQMLGEAVAEAIATGATLVSEAGTGTGKTFAYLVPALLSGRRVIISTGTRTLQDQLFHRDLPLVRRALEVSVRTTMLKGRANYLCRYRFERTAAEGRFDSHDQSSRFQRLRRWAEVTRSGDMADSPLTGTDTVLLNRVTSNADNCLGQECPRYSDCFLMEARRDAQTADVLVVNHHLLMADWAVREGGFGEVLPEAEAYILDEAHQLPDTAAQFFGLALSSRRIADLVRDTRLEQRREAPDSPQLSETADSLNKAALDFRLALGESPRRAPWRSVADGEAVSAALGRLQAALEMLREALAPQAGRGKGIESCWRRAAQLGNELHAFLEPEAPDAVVQWFETRARSFLLRLTPLEVADTFRAQMARRPGAWIFTSATLSVAGRFEHFIERLGLDEPRTLRLESPFDYRRNALLYVPSALPAPNAPEYPRHFLEVAERVLRVSRGRAFLLFTSHRVLDMAARHLAQRVDHPLLVQGEQSQNRLLERFREMGDAVLLGTQSFWEGVDVRGEALSCVMIDRLPFASPSDPVNEARIESLRRRQGNPFVSHQLPDAVIALRQGVGRLIRDATDRGVLVIGDNRLVTKSYGRVFIRSLPEIPLTRDFDAVAAFFS